MKYHLTLFLLATNIVLFAQTENGASPLIPQSAIANPPSVRAVVIGISDYQTPAIPDLQFADRDANAFAAWLRSPAGGSVPEANITLLTNAEATGGKFAMALTGLIDECKPGEQAIIYFSGHGDVETKTVFQLGFLLCHDSPASNYMGGGFNLFNLQAVISTLAVNGVQTLVVTDACRAGKLAGSTVNGAQLTNANLAKPWNNEVKILSCQPNELSIEGEQWGGGRGVFSYHLVEGLTGLADGNGDALVNLMEIGRYLEERVPNEAAPHPQVPFTVGDRLATVALVDADALALLEMDKSRQSTSFKTTGMRGLGDALLSKADSTMYQAFLAALDSGNLLEPAGNCADDYYRQLVQVESLRPVWGLLRRNFAAALQDEVQQALNALMESDPYEVNHWRFNPEKYSRYPAYLTRSLELVGENHYLYKTLLARKLYFEAYNLQKAGVEESDFEKKEALKTTAKSKLLEALQLEPGAAYILHAIGYLYFDNVPYQSDSLFHYCEQANRIAPTWLLPYVDVAQEWMWVQSRMDKAKVILEKILEINPESFIALERYAWCLQGLGEPEKAVPYVQKLIELRPDLTNGYSTLANIYLSINEYALAEPLARKGIELAPEMKWWAYTDYGNILSRTRRFSESEAHLMQAIQDSTTQLLDFYRLKFMLAYGYLQQREYEELEPLAKDLIQQTDTEILRVPGAVFLGIICLSRGEYAEAKKYMQAALEFDPTENPYDNYAGAYLALLEELAGRPDSAAMLFQTSKTDVWFVNVDIPFRSEYEFLYGGFLLRQGQKQAAFEKFTELTNHFPKDYRGWYGLALYHAQQGDRTAALDHLEKALDLYYPIPQPILEEPLFKKIRKTKRFKALLKIHFTEQFKD